MKKVYAILNLISTIFLIAWNGYANTGNYNGKTVGELSAEYNNLFTPASYAFSIWGLIFLMLLGFGISGVYNAFAKANNIQSQDYRTDFITTTSPWFLIANIFCSVWVVFWLDEMIGISVICMLGILISLLMCVKKLDIGRWNAPFPIIIFVWWALSLYAGWISVATIANIAAYLNGVFNIEMTTQVYITMVMIVVAFIVNLGMLVYRNMRVFTLVGVWALVAIFMRFRITQNGLTELQSNQIAYLSIGLACMLTVIIAIQSFKNIKINHLRSL